MKPPVYFLLLCCLIGGHASFGQRYRNAVGVSLGSFRLRTLDQQASPLRYSGSIRPHVGLSYRHLGENSRFSLRLAGGAGTMNPDRLGPRTYSTTFPDGKTFSYQISSVLYNVGIEADYLRRVSKTGSGNSAVWVGAALQESIWYADEVANFPWVVNTATLAPVVQFEQCFQPRHGLTLRVDMAVIGLITRAIYANFPKSTSDNNVTAFFRQGTRTATLSNLGNVNVQLGYNYRLSPHLSLGASYRGRYLSYPSPQPIRAVSSTVSFDSEIRF